MAVLENQRKLPLEGPRGDIVHPDAQPFGYICVNIDEYDLRNDLLQHLIEQVGDIISKDLIFLINSKPNETSWIFIN